MPSGDKIKKILFVCYGAGHVNMLLPIIKNVTVDGSYNYHVLGLTTAGPVLEEENIPYVGFKDFVCESDAEALKFGEEFAKKLPRGKVSVEETVAYLGLSFYDLVLKHGRCDAFLLYEKKGRQAFLPTSVLQRVFDQLSPDLLISTNSPRAERAAFIVAREKKISSICIVGLFAKHEVSWISEPGFAEKICVLSEGVKNSMIAAGCKKDQLFATGNPAFDRLADPVFKRLSKQMIHDNGWVDKKVILWASQPEPKRHPFTGAAGDPSLPRRVENFLLGMAKNHPEWVIVIRHHPGENVDFNASLPNVYLSNKNDNLAVLLNAVDVVITMTSTVGIEGLLLKKPLITIQNTVFLKDAPYSEMGLSLPVKSLDNLENSIKVALSGQWLPTDSLPKVGEASEKIYRLISDCLN